MPFFYGLQGDTCSCYLHPEVGGVLLAAADLLGLPIPRDNDSVASGPARAGGCPVSVGVGLWLIRAQRPSTHRSMTSFAWVPSSRTIRCSRSTSRFACWRSRSPSPGCPPAVDARRCRAGRRGRGWLSSRSWPPDSLSIVQADPLDILDELVVGSHQILCGGAQPPV